MGRRCLGIKIAESTAFGRRLSMPGVLFVVGYNHDCAEFCQTSLRATSILDEVVAGF